VVGSIYAVAKEEIVNDALMGLGPSLPSALGMPVDAKLSPIEEH
jgi:hypothetical protein